jgi:hypothetical protein
MDQRVDAGVLVLPDQFNGLGHGTDTKLSNGPRAAGRPRFAATAASQGPAGIWATGT